MESDEAEILIVYQKEPHAGQMAFREIAQPESFESRVELARKMKTEYEMPMTVLVDTMEDQSRALFSDLPSPVFIIDEKGVIRAKFPWPEAEQIAKTVSGLDEKKSKRGLNLALIIAIVLPLFVVFASRKKTKAAKDTQATDAG